MLPEGITRMIDIGKLRIEGFDESDVVGLWNKAVIHAADSKLPTISVDGSTSSGYSAVHEAAMAVLAHHGLRTGRTVKNHHEMVFAAVDVFQVPGLEDLVADATRIRSYRKGALYDPDIATDQERDLTLAWMDAVLPLLHKTLLTWNPNLSEQLKPYP